MTWRLNDITFPLFGVAKAPEYIEYGEDVIRAWMGQRKGFKQISDYLPGETYLQKLIRYDSAEIKRLEFDHTFRNITELIRDANGIRWAVDNNCQFYDFERKTVIETKKAKVEKIINNNIYVKGVSYPFPLPSQFDQELLDLRGLYAVLAKYRNTWYLYKFSQNPKQETLKI